MIFNSRRSLQTTSRRSSHGNSSSYHILSACIVSRLQLHPNLAHNHSDCLPSNIPTLSTSNESSRYNVCKLPKRKQSRGKKGNTQFNQQRALAHRGQKPRPRNTRTPKIYPGITDKCLYPAVVSPALPLK